MSALKTGFQNKGRVQVAAIAGNLAGASDKASK
jgi:hypothetical protein